MKASQRCYNVLLQVVGIHLASHLFQILFSNDIFPKIINLVLINILKIESMRCRIVGCGVWLIHPLSGNFVGSNPADTKNPTMLRVGAVQAGCDPRVILTAQMPLVRGYLANGNPASQGGSTTLPTKKTLPRKFTELQSKHRGFKNES